MAVSDAVRDTADLHDLDQDFRGFRFFRIDIAERNGCRRDDGISRRFAGNLSLPVHGGNVRIAA